MEETAPVMNFIAKKGESSYIKVIGVGGGGTNAVNHMYREGITGVDFIVCNTDSKSLASSPVTNKIQLGDGLGAGNKPDVAKRYASENTDAIRAALSENTKMLFITAGMGGGTGTGASPIIAQIAKEIDLDDKDVPKILVVAIVTMPFNFEGRARMQQAEEGVKELRKYVDSILIIDNNKVLGSEKIAFSKAFAKADDVLLTAAKSVAEMITVDAYINTDFRDVNTVMKESGTALMGAGIAEGENRAIEAIQAAVNSPLLNDNDISDAQNILLHITCNKDHEFDTEEMEEVTNYLTTMCKNEPTIIWGIGYDDSLEEKVRIIVVATGFQKSERKELPLVSGTNGIVDEKKKMPLDINKESEQTTKVEPKVEQLEPATTFTIKQKAEETASPVASIAQETAVTAATTSSEVSEPRKYILQMDDVVAPVTDEKPITEVTEEISFEGFQLKSKDVETSVMHEMQPEAQVQLQHEQEPAVAPQNRPRSVVELDATRTETLEKFVNERMSRIQQLKNQMSTPEGLAKYENEPSYRQNGVELTPSNNDDSNKIIDKDGNISSNSYLYTSVD